MSVGTAHEDDITCIVGDTFHVYTASGTTIRAWRRGTELKHEYKGHEKKIHLMLPFGPHLIAVDETNKFIILEFDRNEKRIMVSHSKVWEHEIEEEIEVTRYREIYKKENFLQIPV